MKQELKVNGMDLLYMRLPCRMISKKNSKSRGRFHGRPFLSAEVRALQMALARAASRYRNDPTPYRGPVAVEITAHWKSRVHADLPNVPEIVCDALQGIVYENDRQIGALLVVACECDKEAVTIRVRTTDRQEGECVES